MIPHAMHATAAAPSWWRMTLAPVGDGVRYARAHPRSLFPPPDLADALVWGWGVLVAVVAWGTAALTSILSGLPSGARLVLGAVLTFCGCLGALLAAWIGITEHQRLVARTVAAQQEAEREAAHQAIIEASLRSIREMVLMLRHDIDLHFGSPGSDSSSVRPGHETPGDTGVTDSEEDHDDLMVVDGGRDRARDPGRQRPTR